MRVWLRPDKLAKLGLTPADVIAAIKEQNLQAPAGRIGGRAHPQGSAVHLHGGARRAASSPPRSSRTSSSAAREGADQIRIRDVGRAELGSQDYNSFGRLDGKPAGAMAVYLLPGADQLKAAARRSTRP